jgi:hypothetical protein
MDESDALSPEREAHNEGCAGLQCGPWAVCLAFVAFTCLLFACSYEIQRYHDAIEWEFGGQLSIWEQLLVIWFLTGKSALLFVPVIPVLAALAWLRKWGMIGPVLLIYWTLIFSWMVLDLESARITGNHVLDYAPYLYDMVRSPDKKYWNWLGGGIVRQVAAVPVVAMGGGLIVYMAVQRGLRWQFLRVGRGKSFTGVLTILFIILLA